MKSDPSFTNTIVWNTLPIPCVTMEERAAVIAAGHSVVEARALTPERSLAELYEPNAMPAGLRAAHTSLDVVVDRLFGATGRVETERQRQRLLFRRYEEMTSGISREVQPGHKRMSQQPTDRPRDEYISTSVDARSVARSPLGPTRVRPPARQLVVLTA